MFAAITACAGVAITCYFYRWQTGYPFPSSYYAKVSGSLSAPEIFSRLRDMVRATDSMEWWLYGIFLIVCVGRAVQRAQWKTWLLPLLAVGGYFIAKSGSIASLGQEHRYISPLRPVLYVFGVGEVIRLLREGIVSSPAPAERRVAKRLICIGVIGLACLLFGYVRTIIKPIYLTWVSVRHDGDISVGRWLEINTPKNSIVSSEPIGSIHLYSKRRTVDVVGLTSPEFLRHYADWNWILPKLREARADYLVYYPKWFVRDGFGNPPKWMEPVLSLDISQDPFNPPHAIGSTPIVVYRLNWARYDKRSGTCP